MHKLMLFATISAGLLSAQEGMKSDVVWKASVLSLAAANALDIHSSWGKHELNPTLSAGNQATFGTHGALIKLGLQGSLLGLEYLVTRGHPTGRAYKALAVVNFGASGAMAAVAAHNYSIHRPLR
jgi:hypothetical protein